ncbi:putative inorganic phosphate cotransporter isoform X1 [Diprion similis]|uniref:putative inorganic phosphate cotransporter isoform X1 n=1 Tax=Diprion similis TaxID=362088 RepID=UPI001EF9256D|nr:putative inorganic phosphate cotransporter isoform X1 [Diprion similis]
MFSSWKICCGRVRQRWVFAVMGCLAITVSYATRICLSLAITQMVTTAESSSNSTTDGETCSGTLSASSSSAGSETYDWDEYTQGIILSSFYWGYIVSQVPGGVMADKFGGKYTLSASILSSTTFTLLTPLVVNKFDSTGLIVLRILMGLGEGTTFPALNVLIAEWAPPHERSKIGTMVMTGTQVGSVVGNALSGILLEYSPIGWPLVFYFFGSLSALWLVTWILFFHSNPDIHPYISETEKKYIQDKISENTRKHTQPIPWRHMATSFPLWGLLIGKFGHDWGYYTMANDLPKYMNNVLKFSITSNGLLTALPYLAMWILSNISSVPADWLIKSGKMTTTHVRKVFTTFGSVGPAIFLVAASYGGCNRVLVVILFIIGVGSMGPYYPGLMVNGVDLSPNYSGTLMAFMISTGSLAGIVTPYVVGVLTPNQTVTEWRLVFWITFAVFMVTNVGVLFWQKGEIQYWNDLESRKNEPKDVESEGTAVKNVENFSTKAVT